MTEGPPSVLPETKGLGDYDLRIVDVNTPGELWVPAMYLIGERFVERDFFPDIDSFKEVYIEGMNRYYKYMRLGVVTRADEVVGATQIISPVPGQSMLDSTPTMEDIKQAVNLPNWAHLQQDAVAEMTDGHGLTPHLDTLDFLLDRKQVRPSEIIDIPALASDDPEIANRVAVKLLTCAIAAIAIDEGYQYFSAAKDTTAAMYMRRLVKPAQGNLLQLLDKGEKVPRVIEELASGQVKGLFEPSGEISDHTNTPTVLVIGSVALVKALVETREWQEYYNVAEEALANYHSEVSEIGCL